MDLFTAIVTAFGVFASIIALMGLYYTRETRANFADLLRRMWEDTLVYWPALAILLAIALVFKFRRLLQMQSSLALFIALALVFLLYVSWSRKQLSRMILYCKGDTCRWEKTSRRIVFGHIEYDPLLKSAGKKPDGFGKVLLDKLLPASLVEPELTLAPEGTWRDWSNVLNGLVEGKCQIVATPLFNTFDRSKKVRFTTPLFFSNVGLYMRKDVASSHGWREKSIPEVIAALKKSPNAITFLYIKGEISEKLAKKYAKSGVAAEPFNGEVIDVAFREIETNSERQYAIFCETYYAENYKRQQAAGAPAPDSGSALYNALKLHELIYPVCFAVRMGDYHLANLVNLRLLDYTRTQGGAIKLLTDMLEKDSNNHLTNTELESHFVADWPFTGPIKEGTVHA